MKDEKNEKHSKSRLEAMKKIAGEMKGKRLAGITIEAKDREGLERGYEMAKKILATKAKQSESEESEEKEESEEHEKCEACGQSMPESSHGKESMHGKEE